MCQDIFQPGLPFPPDWPRKEAQIMLPNEHSTFWLNDSTGQLKYEQSSAANRPVNSDLDLTNTRKSYI
jgi:hypothetical protein